MGISPADAHASFIFLHMLHDDSQGLEPDLNLIIYISGLDEDRKSAIIEELLRIEAIRKDGSKWVITEYGSRLYLNNRKNTMGF